MTMNFKEFINEEIKESKVMENEKVKVVTNGILKYEFPDTDEFNNMSINLIDYTTREQNVLSFFKVETFGDLIQALPKLYKLKNCGKAVQKGIIQKFIQYYLDMLSDEDQIMFLYNLYLINEGNVDLIDQYTVQQEEVA